MKHFSGILTFVLVIAMAIGTAFDADAQKHRTTTKKKSTPVTNTVTKLDCPAYDAANPANADGNGEALSEFLDKWATNLHFRAERSEKVSFGNYFEGELFVGDEPNDFMLTVAMNPYECIAEPSWHDLGKNFKEPYKKVKKRGAKELGGQSAEWLVVNADLAVFAFEDWNNSGDYGGSSIQYIFQRIDGKWYLTAISMAG